jgi:hypothetical protein
LALLVVAEIEDVVHYLIAGLLLTIAGYVVYRTAVDLLRSGPPFSTRVRAPKVERRILPRSRAELPPGSLPPAWISGAGLG